MFSWLPVGLRDEGEEEGGEGVAMRMGGVSALFFYLFLFSASASGHVSGLTVFPQFQVSRTEKDCGIVGRTIYYDSKGRSRGI